MSENSDEYENFTALASRLGLSPAEMLVVTHKVGLGIFDPNYGTIDLSPIQIAKIIQHVAERETEEESQPSNKKPKKKTRRQQNNVIKAKKKNNYEKDPLTIREFETFFNLPEEDIRNICEENDITISGGNHTFSRVDRRKLTIILTNRKLNGSLTDAPETIIPVIETKRANPMAPSSAPVERAVNKRISVLARELETEEDTLHYVIDALQIRIIHDRFEKVEVRHEQAIRTALKAMANLPRDFNDRGEIKLKAIASAFGVPHSRLVQFCAEQGIPIRHTRYVSPHGGLRIATLLNSQDIVQELNRNNVNPASTTAAPQNTEELVEQTPAVNYQGITLTRQNFKEFSFEKSDMRQVDLSFSILVQANLKGVDATDGEFSRVQAALSDFSNANLSNARFDHADLSRSSLRNSCCIGTSFSNTNLQRADFTGANLTNADFRWADLSGAIFSNTTWINGKVINSPTEAVLEN
ncbi:MAG: pentapeptide repeat-containing protein [Acidimicrobiaceae bacterium]|jgi:hypothetical protein